MRKTTTLKMVVGVLMEEPAGPHYGYEIMDRTGLGAGTVYPILTRLKEAGMVSAEYEVPRPGMGRPVRVLYRMTPEGRRTVKALKIVP